MKSVEIVYRYGTSETTARPRPETSNAALSRLNNGNRAFAELLRREDAARKVIHVDAADLGLADDGVDTPPQRPFAAVVGCADARVPVELIFGEGPNDLFVTRIAGNGLGAEVLGSLKYASDHLDSLRLMVVLGHSGCGALTAAVETFLRPTEYLTLATQHALRGIIDRQLIVVQASAKQLERTFGADVARRPGYRDALIETAIATNAALSAHTLDQELTRMEMTHLRAVHGVYRLDTREVWSVRGNGTEAPGLSAPPETVADFLAFGEALMQADRIAGLLC